MCAFISMAQLLSTPSLAVQQYQSILLTSHSPGFIHVSH